MKLRVMCSGVNVSQRSGCSRVWLREFRLKFPTLFSGNAMQHAKIGGFADGKVVLEAKELCGAGGKTWPYFLPLGTKHLGGAEDTIDGTQS